MWMSHYSWQKLLGMVKLLSRITVCMWQNREHKFPWFLLSDWLLVYYLTLSSDCLSLKVKGSSFVSCWRMKDSLLSTREFLPKGNCVLLGPASPWRAGLWYQKASPFASHTNLLAVEHWDNYFLVCRETHHLLSELFVPLFSRNRGKGRELMDSFNDLAHFLDFRVTCPDPFPPRTVLPGMLEHWFRSL